MPAYKKIFTIALSGLFLCGSCFKEVDLDQASEIVIPPTAALDLIYFTLDLEDFHPLNTSGPKMAGDVVRNLAQGLFEIGFQQPVPVS